MKDQIFLLDPTAEQAPAVRARPARPGSFEGLCVGILDISKARGDVFLDEIERQLHDRGIATRRYKKPTFAKIAPPELRQQIAAECGAVIEALAD
ncbi:MAG: hypothetical protein K9K81_09750 [Desulfobacteraceae bacterium]|nr:hypothetical protein [Desulfobacteraceae bacterium]